MKNITKNFFCGVFISGLFFVLQVQAGVVRNADYVSPMNYELPALEVSTSQLRDEVTLVLKAAVLSYPDHKFNFEQRKELRELLEVPNLNSLIVVFSTRDCLTKTSHSTLSQLFSCKNSMKSVLIKGAVTDFDGKIISVGNKTIVTSYFRVGLRHVVRETPTQNLSFLQVFVKGTIPRQREDQRGPILIDLTKSYLEPKRF